MTKNLILTILIVIAQVVAQNSPPSVIFHGNCTTAGRGFRDWVRQTHLSDGEPYRLDAKQKAQLFAQYSKLKLQMSLDEVETLLGHPNFTLTVPPARLATSPEPVTPQCTSQLVYVVEKNTDNMLDTADVAIYLFFSAGKKLYWTSPQNLPDLKPLGSPIGVTAPQSAEAWKEYTFAEDGFAVTFPEAPHPHPDSQFVDTTVYTVSVSPVTKLSLRVSHQNMDCATTLARLKDPASKGEEGAIASSVKDVSIDGFLGVEYEYRLGGENKSYDRFYCVNGKLYTFSSAWSGSESVPTGITRIMDSFRLLRNDPRNHPVTSAN